MHAIAAYPAPGQGESCGNDAVPTCGVPIDAPIELRFDRFLRPGEAIRQSLQVCLGTTDNCAVMHPDYDVVERVVVYRLAAGQQDHGRWFADTLYTVVLTNPQADAGNFGFRAFDGAPIEASAAVPLVYRFKTGSVARHLPALEPPAPRGSEIEHFLVSGCLATTCPQPGPCKGCHDPPVATNAPVGFVVTPLSDAIDRVAHETLVDPNSRPQIDPARFGANMPLISPGEPSNSYLLYKLLMDPNNYGARDCSSEPLATKPACNPAEVQPDSTRAFDTEAPVAAQPHEWCPPQPKCTGPAIVGDAGAKAAGGAGGGAIQSADCLLESPSAAQGCLNDPRRSCYEVALPPGQTVIPSADEIRRLRNWFGAGDPMPLPYIDHAGVLQVPEVGKPVLRMIQAWIRDSGTCLGPASSNDAGTSSGGADAGK